MMCSSVCVVVVTCVFFFKQKTAYVLRISDWSSDVCSSDLQLVCGRIGVAAIMGRLGRWLHRLHLSQLLPRHPLALQSPVSGFGQIGRAACRERVCQSV